MKTDILIVVIAVIASIDVNYARKQHYVWMTISEQSLQWLVRAESY